MKAISRILIFTLVTMLAFGCATKDEKARTNIVGVWQVSKVFQNGQEVTSSYLSTRITYRLSFDNNGVFEESYYPFSGSSLVTVTGTWVFSDGIKKVTLSDNNQTRIYEVDLLDEDNFNVTDLGSTNNRQIQFVPE